MKKWLVIFLALITLIILPSCSFESNEDIISKDDISSMSISDSKSKVSLTIRCDSILDNEDKLDESLKTSGIVPEDGIILDKTYYDIPQDNTVFGLLKNAAQENKIHIDYVGIPNVYIKGIGNIYEFSCGPNSGWIFKVNGKASGISSGRHKLSPGDEVEWVYSIR